MAGGMWPGNRGEDAFDLANYEPMEVDDPWEVQPSDSLDVPRPEVADSRVKKKVSPLGSMLQATMPTHWEEMKPGANCTAVVLRPETEEYIKVAFQFMSGLKFPDTEVSRIYRIQNPFLWKHYVLKHDEMMEENEGEEVAEKSLFHGTKCANIDAICKKGFDWRVSGRHGTKFGQGCYFAQASKFSHGYSPKAGGFQDRSDILKAAINLHQGVQPSHCNIEGTVSNNPSTTAQGRETGHGRQGSIPLHDSQLRSQSSQQFKSFETVANPFMRGHSSPSLSAPQSCAFPLPSMPDSKPCAFPLPSKADPRLCAFPLPSKPDPNPCAFPLPSMPDPKPCAFPLPSTPDSKLCAESSDNRFPSGTDSHSSVQGQRGKAEELRYMFLTRVLVGKSVRGHADYRRPPALHPGDVNSKLYDSCVNSTDNPTIFVVFDSNQAYPEYIVEYRYFGKD